MTKKRLFEVLEKHIGLLALIIVGVVGRICLAVLLPAGMDMFAFVALISFSAGYMLKNKLALLVPLAIMVSSDLFLYLFSGRIWPYSSSLLIWIGIFVWTGFAMMALLGLKAGRRTSNPNPLWFAAGTVWGVLLYDIWTNVGWWLGPYYPNTLEGLAACLLMAAPFMAWHMLSTAALLPAAYAGVWFVNKHGSSLASRFARKRPDSALAEGEWEQRLS